MYHIFFIDSSVDGQVGWFHFLDEVLSSCTTLRLSIYLHKRSAETGFPETLVE